MIVKFKDMILKIIQYFKIKRVCAKTGLHTASRMISPDANYGKNVRIGKGVITTSNVTIGDNTYINRNTTVENCVIGKYCSISEGVRINPVEHNLNLVSTHPILGENGHFGISNKPVKLGNDVLISLNSIILQGVTIGDGAVIGAGAVVTKDIPPYAVAAGVPAKVIRYRFDDEKIKMLEKIRWWDWPSDKIERNLGFLRNETDKISE